MSTLADKLKKKEKESKAIALDLPILDHLCAYVGVSDEVSPLLASGVAGVSEFYDDGFHASEVMDFFDDLLDLVDRIELRRSDLSVSVASLIVSFLLGHC